MRWMWRVAAGAAMLGGLVLAGCGGNSDSNDGTAQLRLINASPGYPSLDLTVDDAKKATAVTTGSASGYASVGVSSISTVITSTGSTTALSTTTRSLTKDVSHTLVAYGWAGALKTAVIEENVSAADTGKAKLMVLNLAADAGSVDVYLTGSDESLDDAVAVASGVAGGGSYGYTALASGTYRLRVTGYGDKTDLRLDVQGLSLGSTQVATLMITHGVGSGGVLVNALLAPQTGTVVAFSNTLARARVVGSVSGNGKVTATLGGTSLLANATSPAIGSYAQVSAGSTVATLVVNGTAVTVPNPVLSAGGDYTLLVWGDAAAPQLTVITDDNRLPTVTSNAKIRLIHGVAGMSSALTLTTDFSAAASNVAQGTASAYANVAASSAMRLDVTSPLSSTALYTLTDANIVAKGLYTVFVLGDSSSPSAALRKDR